MQPRYLLEHLDRSDVWLKCHVVAQANFNDFTQMCNHQIMVNGWFRALFFPGLMNPGLLLVGDIGVPDSNPKPPGTTNKFQGVEPLP